MPRCDHIPGNHISGDSRHEGISARIRNQPPLPFQLVQRFVERLAIDSAAQAQIRAVHAVPQNARRPKHALSRRRQLPKSNSYGRHDSIGKLPRERITERPERAGPGAVALTQVAPHEGWVGKSVAEFEAATGSRVGLLTRFGTGMLPTATMLIQSGDTLHALTTDALADTLRHAAEHAPDGAGE